MNDRTNALLIVVVVLCVGVLFFMNITDVITDRSTIRFISPAEVRGIAVEHEGKLFTLNFAQQNRVIALCNQAIKVGSEGVLEAEAPDFEYDKILIYRFEKPNLVMTPLGLINTQLLFRLPEWNPKGLIRETGPGELNSLLAKTYDP